MHSHIPNSVCNRVCNMVKTFEDLVVEFDIPITDQRKYDSLVNVLYLDWFIDHQDVHENIFDKIVLELLRKLKVPIAMLIRYYVTKINHSRPRLVITGKSGLVWIEMKLNGLLYTNIFSNAQV